MEQNTIVNISKDGLELPFVNVVADTLPEAWENAVLATWENGAEIKTQYDKEGDSPSRDVSLNMIIRNPFAEPRIHLAFPGGIDDLEVYRQEVVDGIHDHWVDPANGKWEYCVGPETMILMKDYSEKPIIEITNGEDILCYSFEHKRLVPATIKAVVQTNAKPYAITLSNGDSIRVSSVHPLYVDRKGWVKAQDLQLGDNIALHHSNTSAHMRSNICDDNTILVTEDDIRNIPYPINHKRCISVLKAKGLLPFSLNLDVADVVILLAGYLFGDGWLGTPCSKSTSCYHSGRIGFAGEYEALRAIRSIINLIGFSTGNIRPLYQNTKIKDRVITGTSLSCGCSHTPLWALFYALKIPVGNKTNQHYTLPEWVMQTDNLNIKKLFLDGFLDAEASAPYKPKNDSGIGASIYFRQNKDESLSESLFGLIDQFKELLLTVGVDSTLIPDYAQEESVSLGLRIGDRDNIAKYLDLFKYPLSKTKQFRANLYLEYLNMCMDTMDSYDCKNLSQLKLPKYKDWLLGRDISKLVFSSISSIQISNIIEPLYDIAVEHPDHNFIANGILSHNTYHERLFGYSIPINTDECLALNSNINLLPCNYPLSDNNFGYSVNQIQYIIDTLSEVPHSRRAQAITWKPWEDCGIYDPACLQSLFCRIFNDKLVMNVRMRSNDAFKAAFMNIFAFTDLQRLIAEKISEKIGRKIEVGQYQHQVDSFHIYGSYFSEFEGFLNRTETEPFKSRIWDSSSEFVQDLFAEAKEKVKKSIEEEKKSGRKGL